MEQAAEPVRKEYREVLRFVRRRVSSAYDAEDIAQEVFVSAAEQLGRSAGAAPPTLGWLYTVARRRLIDEARRRARRMTVPLELVEEPTASTDDIYGRLVARTFDEALRKLSDNQRRVVLLRLIEGRTFSEIAEKLNVSEEACRMRFTRALQRLREEFEKEGLAP